MKRFQIIPSVVIVGVVAASAAWSAQKSEPKSAGKVQFELMKKLSGEWTGKAAFDEGNEQSTIDATVTYRVTAAGSALIETLGPGTDHEMVTMYHLNGDDLILTHYCAAGNQPRMKAAATDNPKKLAFKFFDGTNLDPAKDHYMRDATIEIVDDDHIKSEWVSFNAGKKSHVAKFDMKRKK